ncbi:MAG TPA: beta-ketoacyl-[acyl-carrier-protein] synthase family protein [Verrucomicrobiae bacterium]
MSVAIAGCGAVTAAGLGLAPLQRAVAANVSALSRREILLGKTPQTIVAGFVPDEIVAQLRAADAVHADSRAFLFAAAALREAAENAGAVLDSVPSQRRGFVLSTTKANIEALDQLFRQQPVSAVAQRQIQPAFLAADLAAAFACRGPVQCVSAACISGLSSLQQGAALIRRGLADVVFVAGVDLISHFVLSGFNTLKSLDPDGCRPFDKARIGLSLGEGAGAIILAKREVPNGGARASARFTGQNDQTLETAESFSSDTLKRRERRAPSPTILLTGGGTSNDANHLTGPSRDGSGLALAIQRALAQAGLAPEQIDFVNAHGTGTPYNDNMEALALRSVFGDRVPPFNSSKGIFGHTLGAAGVLETILCVAALQTKLLPGTPRLCERDPVAPESLLAEPRAAAKLDRVLKVNCGFGGTNAALILERELP